MGRIILGIVADDFTGASDAASFLVQQGIKTYLFNGIPEEKVFKTDENIAVVIALKTRTEQTAIAVQQSLEAFDWLKSNQAAQLYIKYCSTFDSTIKGNIGPIIDAVLEKYNIPYTILAPALPINGRIVKNGHLIINGIPLNETHMQFHPLTPMWDSDLENLMKPQGKYPSLKVDAEMLEQDHQKIRNLVNDYKQKYPHFYIIPDYIEEKQAEKIVELFGDLQLLTGGSGLMTELGKKYNKESENTSSKVKSSTDGKAIILSGSCSQATLSQVEAFKHDKGKAVKINPLALESRKQTLESIWEEIQESEEDTILVYSSDKPENVKEAQLAGSENVSYLLEQTTAHIATKAVANGYSRVIVAGGETSGAVTKILGYSSYIIGDSIAPGVPIMVPLKNKKLRLVLKSGNFGEKDFFLKAAQLTKEDHRESF